DSLVCSGFADLIQRRDDVVFAGFEIVGRTPDAIRADDGGNAAALADQFRPADDFGHLVRAFGGIGEVDAAVGGNQGQLVFLENLVEAALGLPGFQHFAERLVAPVAERGHIGDGARRVVRLITPGDTGVADSEMPLRLLRNSGAAGRPGYSCDTGDAGKELTA